jgi:hypothetical protein
VFMTKRVVKGVHNWSGFNISRGEDEVFLV